MNDISEDDVTALREQGDLPAYLRSLIHRRSAVALPVGAPPVDHRPGAWPTACTPPADD